MQPEIEHDLLETAAGQERRDGVDVDDAALERHAGRHADDVRFRHAFHEEAVRHLLAEVVEGTNAEIRADEDDAFVLLRELVDHIEAALAHLVHRIS